METLMNKNFLQLASMTVLCASMSGVFAQEMGRVISSTPIVQQVGVPRQVCSNEQVVVNGQKSGAGAAMGAIAGGAIGNSVGKGDGFLAAQSWATKWKATPNLRCEMFKTVHAK